MQGGRWRRAIAIVLVPAALVVPALGINVEFGKYPTLGTVVQSDPWPAYDRAAAPLDTMPTAGVVRTARIPGTRSHFDARPAVVYLPPAALVRDPRPLPVVIAFSGQPGAPGDLFTAGRLAEPLDAYARAHDGRAPIVVSVDQLSAPGKNTMCVDSRLGNVATYVMHDVPTWIERHLPVTTDRKAWGLTGFSQGGTCTMQFLTGHPSEFGAALAVSSELQPTDQGPQHSADQAFGGSVAAWRAAAPIAQMRENGLDGHALWLTAGRPTGSSARTRRSSVRPHGLPGPGSRSGRRRAAVTTGTPCSGRSGRTSGRSRTRCPQRGDGSASQALRTSQANWSSESSRSVHT